MAIEGHLSEMDLATLVQHACVDGQHSRLQVQHDGITAEIYFEDGKLVHATAGDKAGEAAFYRVLRWEDGSFRLESSIPTPDHTITVPWSALLMDGLQRADEASWDQTDYHEEEGNMPENIQNILVELGSEVPGFVAAAVVGMDGLEIAGHAMPGVNADAISTQMTLLLKLIDTTVNKLSQGTSEVEDYLLATHDAYVLVRYLQGNSHFLVLGAMREKTKLGSMRLNSRLCAERLSKALPR